VKHRWKILPVLGFAALSGAPLAPARADCVSICQENCFSPGLKDYDQNFCMSRIQRCQQQCYARRQNLHGAIAYGASSTAWGYSFDEETSNDAERSALRTCRQNGDDCKIVASFSNACAAVAAVESKGVFAVGQSSTRGNAESDAMSACSRQYGEGCEIEVWTCALP
jgi:hypothetical protein